MSRKIGGASNANDPAALREVARRYAEAQENGVNADPARAAAVVQKMLDGAPIGFGSFYVGGPGSETKLPAKDLLRAQLVKLLADIGMGESARFIDDPQQGAKNVGRLVDSAIQQAREKIDNAFKYYAPGLEELERQARRFSASLVFDALAGQVLRSRDYTVTEQATPESLATLQEFAKAHGLEEKLARWEGAVRAADKEDALKGLIHRPDQEGVEKARALGATPAELKKVARQAYLTSLEFNFIKPADVEAAFASVGFKSSSISKQARGEAAARKAEHEKRDLAGEVRRLSGGVSSDEVEQAVTTLRRAYLSKALPEGELAKAAIDLWLKAEAKTWTGPSSGTEPLRAIALSIAGKDAVESAAKTIEALQKQEFEQAREFAIRSPSQAIFGRAPKQGWLDVFAERFDAKTGQALPEALTARMDRAVIRFWNAMVNDPDVKPEVRESWKRFLPDRFPLLRDQMTDQPRHFVGDTDLADVLHASPFAVSKDWTPFVEAALSRLKLEPSLNDVYGRFEEMTRRPPTEWGSPSPVDMSRERSRQFGAEAARLVRSAFPND